MSARFAGIVLGALALTVTLAAPASAAQFDTSLVSRATGASGAKANGEARSSSLSADGRYVAFMSAATNLDPADTTTGNDVYVRDRTTGTTTLVSRASGAGGAKGNGFSARPMISGDGRYVVFESGATNLDPDDSDTTADVFVRDLQAETTTLVSRASGASGAKGTAQSFRPAISEDGDRIAFHSSANNLHPDDADNNDDVFVRDLSAATTTLVSRAGGASGANANALADDAAISADGGSVAFTSTATNLHADDSDGHVDVFVRDLAADTTTFVSRATGATGANSNQRAHHPSISGNGARVAFDTWSDNLSPDDSSTDDDVYVRDLIGVTTTLVSRATGASGAKGNGIEPAISSDGDQVAFISFVANMDPADPDTNFDIFVRDLASSTTTLASRASGASGAKGNDSSSLSDSSSQLSEDGGYVVFDSASTNLSPDDSDVVSDVYIRQLGSDPSQPLTVGRAGSGSGTVTSDVPGISCGATCSANYPNGTVVTLTASPAAGSDFQGWSGACSGTGACVVTMSAARAVTATFTPTPPPPPPPPPPTFGLTVTPAGAGTGTVTSDVPGISCGASCSASYSSGTVVTLTASPAAGSDFAGWSGDCAGTGACVVTMSAARAVTATFAPTPAPPPPPLPGRCANAQTGSALVGTAAGDRLTGTAGKDDLSGMAGEDCLLGRADADRLDGGSEADELTGESGNDVLVGGTGDDTMSGGTGNDRLTGGAGKNRLTGGDGNDRFSVRNGARDRVRCGGGLDRVTADPTDLAGADCESVQRA